MDISPKFSLKQLHDMIRVGGPYRQTAIAALLWSDLTPWHDRPEYAALVDDALRTLRDRPVKARAEG